MPQPLSVYGRSKREGEFAVQQVLPDAIIFRARWVCGVHGKNFVKSILQMATERDQLSVVDDQVGTPIWTVDIVSALITLIEQGATDVVHFSNEGVASWNDFANELFLLAQMHGFPVKVSAIQPIPAESYPTPAERLAYSVLS